MEAELQVEVLLLEGLRQSLKACVGRWQRGSAYAGAGSGWVASILLE